MDARLFQSFFLGGFECSTHRLGNGRRLDVIHSTRHDELAASDYRLLQSHGIHGARDGLRWHLIEKTPGNFDFSTAAPLMAAAKETGMQVIWDLWHYGWPDDIDIFSAEFVRRFTRFACASAEVLSEYFEAPYISPINEISFFSWAGGEGGVFNPFVKQRGDELKRQLARATIESISAMRAVNPKIRFFQIDPIINVLEREDRPEDRPVAEAYRQSQFEAWDMISGRTAPELGGQKEFLDVIGVNYYINNQWVHLGGPSSMIVPSNPRYRHVRTMLKEVYSRYQRPIFIAETGIENEARPAWFRYMCNEAKAALLTGVPVEGLCLYPILNHPGWDDDRHCYNGLFDYADAQGCRKAYEPLAAEIARQRQSIDKIKEADGEELEERLDLDASALDLAAHFMEKKTDEARSGKALAMMSDRAMEPG